MRTPKCYKPDQQRESILLISFEVLLGPNRGHLSEFKVYKVLAIPHIGMPIGRQRCMFKYILSALC